MTRHGMVQMSAAGAVPPATDRCAPFVIFDAEGNAHDRIPGRQHRADAQRSGLSASKPLPPDNAPAIADISGKSNSP